LHHPRRSARAHECAGLLHLPARVHEPVRVQRGRIRGGARLRAVRRDPHLDPGAVLDGQPGGALLLMSVQPDVRAMGAITAATARPALPGETGMVEKPRARWLPFSPWHFVLMPVAIIMLVPLLWVVMTSLETLAQTQHFPPILWPGSFQWSNYPRAWSSVPFDTWFINTIIVTTTVVVSNLLFCSLAAYGFARIRFFGKSVAYFFLLATLMIPVQVVIIPTFLIVKQMHLIDTLGALIVPNLANVF